MAHPIRKRFGQHFLTDPFIIQQLVTAIDLKDDEYVIEIGPGLGAMTLPLLGQSQVKEYLALEIDRDALRSLKANTSHIENFSVIEADALRTDFDSILTNAEKFRLVGNLPYNISTPLIFHLLGFKERIQDMTFMLQKEVVDRMVAGPNNKTYGRLSVMTQAHCHAEKLFQVPPEAFDPPPKVDSAIIKLTPHTKYSLKDTERFADVVRSGFNQRRKTIRNSLKEHVNTDDLAELNIDPKLRAENLSVENFIQITNLVLSKEQ